MSSRARLTIVAATALSVQAACFHANRRLEDLEIHSPSRAWSSTPGDAVRTTIRVGDRDVPLTDTAVNLLRARWGPDYASRLPAAQIAPYHQTHLRVVLDEVESSATERVRSAAHDRAVDLAPLLRTEYKWVASADDSSRDEAVVKFFWKVDAAESDVRDTAAAAATPMYVAASEKLRWSIVKWSVDADARLLTNGDGDDMEASLLALSAARILDACKQVCQARALKIATAAARRERDLVFGPITTSAGQQK